MQLGRARYRYRVDTQIDRQIDRQIDSGLVLFPPSSTFPRQKKRERGRELERKRKKERQQQQQSQFSLFSSLSNRACLVQLQQLLLSRCFKTTDFSCCCCYSHCCYCCSRSLCCCCRCRHRYINIKNKYIIVTIQGIHTYVRTYVPMYVRIQVGIYVSADNPVHLLYHYQKQEVYTT